MFDLVLKNGHIVDGTGKEAYRADIGIIDDRIVKIGQLDLNNCKKVIDVTDKYVTPGFINMHSHADCSAFLFPDCESYIKQGITTFVGGNCGDSNAPLNNYWMRKFWEYDMWNDIDPYIFYPDTIQPVEKVKKIVFEKTGIEIDWKTFGEYLNKIQNIGISVNMISLLGHSQLRADVVGKNGNKRPTKEEMRKMKAHITEAIENGAWGISFGRDYPPSAYADEAEIIELLNHVKRYGGFYSIHWKRTGIRKDSATRPNKLDGIKEALRIAMKTDMKVQISHLDSGYEIYPSNPEIEKVAAQETLKVLDEYIDRGVDVAFDVIPGTSGGIIHVPYLIGNFMPWVKQSGSIKQFSKNLMAKDYRDSLINTVNTGKWYSINPNIDPEWDKKIVIIKCLNSNYINKSINKISKEKAVTSIEVIFEILLEDPKTMIRKYSRSKEVVHELLKHRKATVCTDTYSFNKTGIYGLEGEVPEFLPHPHTYCAFPKYILEFGMNNIENTIKKVTGFPAVFLGLTNRGVIKEQAFADLVVLDLNNLKTNENYFEPRNYPDGIEYVLVNGKIAVNKNQYTGKRAGRLLKK